jgi:zinc transport system substrate-binding protein
MPASYPSLTRLPVLIILIVLIGLLGFIGLKKLPGNLISLQTNKLHVTASFYPLYYFASRIGGEKAIVTNITPAGQEPHDYEPLPKDIATIEDSRLLLVNGLLEPWLANIKANLQNNNITIITTSEQLPVDVTTDENRSTQKDPHTWLSSDIAKQEVNIILQGFIKVDPGNQGTYQKNALELLSDLNELDQGYRQGLKTCANRNIITSHTAFTYLAKAYNLTQIPIAGISPDTEPSTKQLTQIAQFAKENKVKYIFFESLVSPKLSDTLSREIGAKTLVLNPLEGLTPQQISQGADYFSIMKDNLQNLRVALSCQ